MNKITPAGRNGIRLATESGDHSDNYVLSRAGGTRTIIKQVERIKVLIADGQLLFAEALSDALKSDPRLELIGDYPTSVSETVDAALLLRPQVLLMDYWLPVEGAVPAIEAIRSFTGETTRILVISRDHSPAMISNVLDSGAVGFLPKSYSVEQVAEAIIRAEAGDSPVFPDELREIVTTVEEAIRSAEAASERLMRLTNREVEVLGLLSMGHPIEQVAKRLEISRSTVNNHIQKILAKSGARSHSEAAAMAKRFGLIGPAHSAIPTADEKPKGPEEEGR